MSTKTSKRCRQWLFDGSQASVQALVSEIEQDACAEENAPSFGAGDHPAASFQMKRFRNVPSGPSVGCSTPATPFHPAGAFAVGEPLYTAGFPMSTPAPLPYAAHSQLPVQAPASHLPSAASSCSPGVPSSSFQAQPDSATQASYLAEEPPAPTPAQVAEAVAKENAFLRKAVQVLMANKRTAEQVIKDQVAEIDALKGTSSGLARMVYELRLYLSQSMPAHALPGAALPNTY